MVMSELILKNRSYRRFHQDVSVAADTLRQLVDLARLSASSANQQPLKFVLSRDPDTNALIFPLLKWAGYLSDWDGPAEGERPAGYIVVIGDKRIKTSFGCDHGIAAQSILLGATERGLGGCIIGSVDRERMHRHLAIAGDYEILIVIALGKPKEEVVIEAVKSDGDIKYWRDSEGKHHVPKRSLEELILKSW
jgi:nitroreductase